MRTQFGPGTLVRVFRDYDDLGTCVGFIVRKTNSTHQDKTKRTWDMYKVLYDGRLYDISARMLEHLEK